jgi:acyl-CoA reductase-like NAD-dependent aldehyde dehydrogenase
VLLAAFAETARMAGSEAGGETPEWSSQPLGSVAAILPERHALFFAAQIAGVAIATGCSVILMAHPLAPLSVVKLVQSALAATWPPGTVNLLYGLHTDLAERLAADPRVALLATAGPMRNRDKLAAARGLRPQIHLGSGYGCALLDRGTDVSGAVTTLLALRFRNPRWGRPAPVFVLTPEALSARLHEALGEGVMSLPGGRPTDMTAVVPWQMTEGAAQAATDWLATVKDLGGKVAFGGRRAGLYVEPAVITAPAGTRPFPPPPPEAPFFIIDSYDKQPRAQLERFPDLVSAAVFTPDAARAEELARLVDSPHVDVFAPAPATGRESSGRAATEDHGVAVLMSDMIRKKHIHLVYTT